MNNTGLRVEITPDGMEAYLVISPGENGPPPGKDEIEKSLASAGVVFGLQEEAIAEALQPAAEVRRILVARGTPPEPGQDGRIEVEADLVRPVGKPAELPDGRVDYRELGLIKNVSEGQVLARRIPPTPGNSGMTVRGEAVPPKPGKAASFKKGRNVQVGPDGECLVAAAEGQVDLGPGGIQVLPVFVVNGDVDLATGNIDFIGSVRVQGAVREGSTVKCAKDLEVEGWVGGATVVAGGNIVIKQGIRGTETGSVTASGNLVVRFIENAEVKAGGNVEVGEAIMHSRVESGKEVIVRGKKGLIVGGVVAAGQKISAKVFGSQLATRTRVEVGIDPELRGRLVQVVSELGETEKHLDQVNKAILLFERQAEQGSLAPDRRDALLRLKRTQYMLTNSKNALSRRKEETEIQIKEARKGRVEVLEMLHPGVQIVIGTSEFLFRDPLGPCNLVLKDGGDIGPE